MTYQEAIGQLRSNLSRAYQHLQKLTDSNTPYLMRLEVPVAPVQPLSWLQQQQDPVKLFWAPRNLRYAVAAIGVADDRSWRDNSAVCQGLESIQTLLERASTDSLPRYFGCIGFDDTPSGCWSGFPYGRFILPLVEISRSGADHRLACNLLIRNLEQRSSAWTRLQRCLETVTFTQTDPVTAPRTYRVKRRCDSLSPMQWRQRVERVLGLEASGDLHKLVLSREVRLELDGPVSPWQLLSTWGQNETNCFSYGLQLDGCTSFLGCSPERLFRLRGTCMQSESVAGTIPRGTTATEDIRQEIELRNNPKVIRENQLVKEFIQHRLHPLCVRVTVDATPSALKLSQVQHLRYRFTGELRPEMGTVELLQALHPTPAVGGVPRALALALIHELEPHARGWYSGAVGCVGSREAEFAVAIRCALLDRRTIRLYSGAGIVPGSDAEAEWQELESKISTPLSLFA